jgi:hypothetical protein
VVSFCAYIELELLHSLCKLLLLYGRASQSSGYGLLPVSEHSCHWQTDFDVLSLFCYVVASPAQLGRSVVIVLGLDIQGITCRFLAGEKDFSLLHSTHTCSGGRVIPIQWVPYQGVKHPCRQADHLLPSSAKVENEWSYTSILYMPS